uniref:G-protein coupled receptors family 3 profile domain-containing protein n=1 Tax=Amphimedon queenslandica TaxID=400682 RepID=A0A1X7U9M5_AMPQE
AYHAGLTTAKHAWILRGMTNPNWWRVEDVNGTDCTNNEMKEAIESALFVDMQTSTLPKMNYEERNAISGILNNNGSLTEAEFYSLLHSKVFNAYDAARILALTWNVTINNYTTEELHNLLNQSWKILNSNQSKTLVQKLQHNLFNVVSPYTGLAGSYDFDKNQGKLGSAINNLSNTKLVVGIGLISAPFIVLLILIQLIQPLEVYQAYFKNHHCPGYPNNTETLLIEDHCIEPLKFGWDILIFSYMIFLLIIIAILGSFNCRIKGHFNKEGELAILAGPMTLLLYLLYVGIAAALQWSGSDASDIDFVMSKYQMSCTFGFILAYNSFFLAVLYGSKAILLCRDKKVKPAKRRSTLRKKLSDLHDEIFKLKQQLQKTVKNAIKTISGKECIIGYYDSTNSTNLQECDTEFAVIINQWMDCVLMAHAALAGNLLQPTAKG